MKKILTRIPLALWAACALMLVGALFGHPAAAAGAMLGGFGGMIIDAQMVLSDAQALTVTALSTNTFDSVLSTNNIPAGEPLAAVITVDVAAKTSNGDETYRFSVIQSANADLSSSDELITTNVSLVTRTLLAKGYRLILPIPSNLKTKRYLGANYTLGGTAPTITVTTEIVPLTFVQNEQVYPKNFTITS